VQIPAVRMHFSWIPAAA